jgi:hypothetical protein
MIKNLILVIFALLSLYVSSALGTWSDSDSNSDSDSYASDAFSRRFCRNKPYPFPIPSGNGFTCIPERMSYEDFKRKYPSYADLLGPYNSPTNPAYQKFRVGVYVKDPVNHVLITGPVSFVTLMLRQRYFPCIGLVEDGNLLLEPPAVPEKTFIPFYELVLQRISEDEDWGNATTCQTYPDTSPVQPISPDAAFHIGRNTFALAHYLPDQYHVQGFGTFVMIPGFNSTWFGMGSTYSINETRLNEDITPSLINMFSQEKVFDYPGPNWPVLPTPRVNNNGYVSSLLMKRDTSLVNTDVSQYGFDINYQGRNFKIPYMKVLFPNS